MKSAVVAPITSTKLSAVVESSNSGLPESPPASCAVAASRRVGGRVMVVLPRISASMPRAAPRKTPALRKKPRAARPQHQPRKRLQHLPPHLAAPRPGRPRASLGLPNRR